MNIKEHLERLAALDSQLCQPENKDQYSLHFGETNKRWLVSSLNADTDDLMVVTQCLKSNAIARGWAYRTYYTRGLGHEVKILVPGSWRVSSDLKNTEALAWIDAYLTASAIAKAVESVAPALVAGEVGHGRS